MDLPLALRNLVEETAAGFPQAELTAAARGLSERYLAGRDERTAFIASPADAAAYTVMRMPATFGAASAAMSLADALLPEEDRPRTVLDAGAGTGASALAACSVFPVERITCLERNSFMRTAGEQLLSRAGAEGLLAAGTAWQTVDLAAPRPLPVRAELVVASYVLNELSPADRTAAALRLWEAADSLLVLVEPGTPAAFSGLKAVQAPLLAAGAHVLAPCPHGDACPLPPDDWCHFTVRVSRSRLAKALKGGDAPYEDEKFSCLILSRKPFSPAPARILRHPAVAPGQITLRLCTPDGIADRTVRKREGACFRLARKSRCGDAFPAV